MMNNINTTKYILVIIGTGAVLGLLTLLLKSLPGLVFVPQPLERFLGGVIVGGGMVGVGLAIYKLIKKGRCKWLLNDD